MTTDFGERIATREFTWLGDDGEPRTGFVDISLPRLVPPDRDGESACYVCMARRRGFGGVDVVRPAYGEDEVQALHLALVLAGCLVAAHPLAARLDPTWGPNFGFPKPGYNSGG